MGAAAAADAYTPGRHGSIDVAFYQAQAMALRAQTVGNALGPNALAKLRAPFKHWWGHVVSQAMSMLARTVPSR